MTGTGFLPPGPPLDEFGRIARFFAPLAGPEGLGLLDDAALLDPPPGRQLVVTADAIVEGVHYFSDDPPEAVARKLLRVNLSDLAAMGAEPLAYTLTMALPAACGESWLSRFAAGLGQDQAEFGIALLGGDSVATPGPATFSVTALGTVGSGKAVRRSGAVPGDLVFVSGTIGDGALGLLARRGGLSALGEEDRRVLIDRYRLPRPRLGLGGMLSGLVHAMIDISDGLVADLGHIAAVSGVAAWVAQPLVPLSPAGRRAVAAESALLAAVLTGGDDYELLFTAPPEAEPAIGALGRALGIAVTRIGWIAAGQGVRVTDAGGNDIVLAARGYTHF